MTYINETPETPDILSLPGEIVIFEMICPLPLPLPLPDCGPCPPCGGPWEVPEPPGDIPFDMTGF